MNPLLLSLRADHDWPEATAQCCKPDCHHWDLPDRMDQCIRCLRTWCQGHWPNEYDDALCLDCWCQRMEHVAWVLRQDVAEMVRAELVKASGRLEG